MIAIIRETGISGKKHGSKVRIPGRPLLKEDGGCLLMKRSLRDKTSLDITWLKDKSLADLDNLPDLDVLAEELAENLERALGSFREVIRQLKAN